MNTHEPIRRDARRVLVAAALGASCLSVSAQTAAVAPAPAASAATLERVTVQGTREPAYRAPEKGTSTKSEVPLIETPMAVQVVPREVLDDQRVYSLKEAVKNVSGVIQAQYDFYDFLQIRGFDNGYAANYRNGLQLQAISGLDMALVERLEVVKGPASMLYGRIEPGGLVNLVTKRPQAERAVRLEQQFGSQGLRRTVADATGRLGSDDTLLYRVVGAATEAKSFMDYVQRRNLVGSAAITWRPSTRFELNAALELQNYRFVDTEDIGIPIIGNRIAPVPRNRFYGDPVNWELPNRQNRKLLALDWSWQIDEHWRLVQRLHWDRRDEQQLTIWLNGFDGVSVMDRGLWFVHPDRTTVATNLDLSGDLEIAGRRHRILVGADAFRFGGNWHGFSGTTPEVGPIDIFAPTYGINADALRALPENFFYADRDRWNGLYAQDQVTLDEHWQVLVGGRFDIAKTGFGDSATSLAEARDAVVLERDRAFSPRAGVLYLLDPTTSLYVSLSRSFGTNNGRTASGATLDPQKARQIEFGVKHQSADGALGITASLFRLTKSNLMTADLSTPDPDDQTTIGEVRNQGLELDVLGRISRHVNVIASYTLTASRIVVDNDGNQGHRLPNVPRHAASLWARYDAAPGAREGWEAGAGVYARSQREGDKANSWQLPGYARVDAMLRWHMPWQGHRLAAQLNVENLFDRSYVDRGGSGGTGAKYGSPRALQATLSLDL